MSGDVLSDLLRTVRLRGAVFYFIEAADPWVAEAPAASEILPILMPGAEHMIEFHGIVRGACWAAIAGESPVRLETGDVVLFPQGDPHVISSAPGMRAPLSDLEFFRTPRPAQLPFTLCASEERMELAGSGRRARPAESAEVVCGFLACDAKPYNPLLAALPRVMHVPGVAAGESWIQQFLRASADESNRQRPGGEAVLERMSEMMFVEVLRRHVDALSPEHTGWLAGLRDPGVSRALSLLHEQPAHAWTLEELGEKSGMSRTVLHERFSHYIGQPPMQYLAQWRMQLAAARLRESDDKVLEVALDVGYESEAAFSRAFRRATGSAPGAWRKARRQRAARR